MEIKIVDPTFLLTLTKEEFLNIYHAYMMAPYKELELYGITPRQHSDIVNKLETIAENIDQ